MNIEKLSHSSHLPLEHATMPIRQDVRLGVIGAGEHFVRAHLQHCLRDPFCKLGNVFDMHPDCGQKLALLTGAAVHRVGSEKELLSGDCAAVLISTPDHLHADSLKAAVDAQKHVFVEKPLAVDLRQLQVVQQALEGAKNKGLVISTCHPRRYDPPFIWLKERIPALQKMLGNAIEFSFDFSYHKPSAWKLTRGLLIDHANHEVDLLHFLFGHCPFEAFKLWDDPAKYHAAGMREDGIAFSFRGTRHLKADTFREWAGIRFERGRMDVWAAQGIAVLRNDETGEVEQMSCPATDYDVRFAGVTRNFFRAVQGLEVPYVTHEDMLVNTEFAVRLSIGHAWVYPGRGTAGGGPRSIET